MHTRFRLPLAFVACLVAGLAAAPPAGAAGTAAVGAVGGPPVGAASVGVEDPDLRSIPPARLADTRSGRSTTDGAFRGTGRVTPSEPLVLTVAGRGGVPPVGGVAVALNVTVTGPTAAGYLTVHPSGVPRPTASNVNFASGETVANAVITKLGADGRVVLYSSAPTHVVVDVSGYFTVGGIEGVTPARLADTRRARPTVDGQHAGTGAVTPGARLDVQVTGRGGVPSGATAVALNVTATAPTGEGYLTVFPAGTSRPNASNLNFLRGQTVANSVVAKVGSGGRVSVHNSNLAVHVIVDVAGYFTAGSDFVPLSPARFADTRSTGSAVAGPWYLPTRNSRATGSIGVASPNGPQLDVLVSGRGSVPLTDTGSVVLNVTVTRPSADGHLTVFPLDTPVPPTSTVNFRAGRSVPNLVVMQLGRGGGVSIRSSVPTAHVVVDVLGWFPGWSTADEPGEWSAIGRDLLDMPLTYDRCYTIPYRINHGNVSLAIRQDRIDDVHTAVGLIEAATGIDFVYLGLSSEVPSAARYDADHVLVALTSPAVVPELGDGVIGYGGSVYDLLVHPVRWIPEQFFHGFAYFDATVPMGTGFGSGLSFGQVALHELAHVVGLGHVGNAEEIMNDTVIARAGHFGPGDLHGLALLYRTQSCPGSPATFGALRAAAGKAAPGASPRIVTSATLR